LTVGLFMHLFASLFCVACGLYCVVGGASGGDWFMRGRKIEAAAAVLGRRGARLFYLVLGLAAVAVGVWSLAGLR
jgi:hypothetical protein